MHFTKRLYQGLFGVCFLFIQFLVAFAAISVSFASEPVLTVQIPYYLGKSQETVTPGQEIQAFFHVENLSRESQQFVASIKLPPGILPAANLENWQVVQQDGECQLERQIQLTGGYSQWFDLIPLKIDAQLPNGIYPVLVTAGDQNRWINLEVVGDPAQSFEKSVTISELRLPLDKDGKQDERLDKSTLVLRDRRFDYYKNMLQGKGATNQEIEAIHPVSYMGIDIENPAGIQKLVVVTTRLLDQNTHQPVAGLFTPNSTGENAEAGTLGAQENKLVVFAALTGEHRQRIRVPIYADEQLLNNGGNYLLQTEISTDEGSLAVKEGPITLIKQDLMASVIIGVAVICLLVGTLWGSCRLRRLLKGFRTRWLITVALFGATAFSVVNVPSTLFGEFFHVLLGPFGFLLNGLFTSVFLYMIVLSLVVLIPHPGVISFLVIIRMLLSLFAFGQFSPILILSYGIHAFTLEFLFYYGGVYRNLQQFQSEANVPRVKVIVIGLICAVAECLASFVGLEAMTVLYRLYYANWYIELVLLVNGLLYTSIGAVCGVRLGKKLSRVGGD